jgi:CheY-like chemotaxis protein
MGGGHVTAVDVFPADYRNVTFLSALWNLPVRYVQSTVYEFKSEPFDIVFMDMQMPEMDGYEATSRLRQAGYLRPIVALTSHSMSGERQRCLEIGCDEYMTKPIDRLMLLQVLSRFLPSDEAEQHLAA